MKNPLTPRWQHEDPSERLEAVASGKLSQEILQQIATEDSNLSVKDAAIELIEAEQFLFDLSGNVPSAGKRWAELLGADLQNLNRLEETPENLLLSVAKFAPQEEFRLRAVELISEAARCEVLRHENLSRVHQHCASALEEEHNLNLMRKQFVDKDKNVSRILKSKLQAIKHAKDVAAAEALELETLLERTQQLRDSEPGQDFARRIDVLQQAYNALPDQQAAEQVKTLLDDCQEILAALPDPAEILRQQLDAITERCADLRAECIATPELETLAETLSGILFDWPEEADEAQKAELTQDLVELRQAQQDWQAFIALGTNQTLSQFEQTELKLTWPDTFSKPEQYQNSLKEIKQALTEEQVHQDELEAQRNELAEQINRFEQQIADGHIKAANRANTKVTRLLQAGKPSNEQRSQVKLLQSKLQELKDWQGFATQPKRDELCEKMSALAVDQTISMPEKAKAIKELQEEWRKLGSSDSRPAQKSWSRFKHLGDQAYAPVAEYFAAQQTEREGHLKEREEICESLEKFTKEADWDNVSNWKEVAGLLQSASTKWRQHGNVPRKNKKAIEKRFDQATQPIRDHLNGIQKKHIEQKEALIHELKSKLEDEQADMAALINRAKSAQQEWQNIGFIDRRKDQKLWKAFRAQCDAVFNRRDVEKQSEKQAAKQIAEQFRALCKEFEASLDQGFERKDIGNFKKARAAIDLPRAHRGLDREAKKLIKQAESELKNRAKQNEELMFQEFRRQCDLLDQGQTAESDGEITLSKSLQTALDNRSEQDEASQDQILIRLEILADLPSPESSQTARMQYQVERLNKELSLGQKETRSEREQVNDLMVEWYSITNKNPEWQVRFKNVATKLGFAS